MTIHYNAVPGKHHRLGPSSSKRWLACPVSAIVVEEQIQNEHTIRGNKLHGICAAAIGLDLPVFPTGNAVDDEHIEWALKAARTLKGDLYVEHYMESTTIPEFGGTIDLLSWEADTQTLTVFDYKFGSYKVYSENNPQLICYLVLALEQFPDAKHFRGGIMQPKRRKTCDWATFTQKQIDEVRAQIEWAATSDHYEPNDGCKFCPLLAQCDAGTLHVNGARGDDWRG